MLRYGLLTFRAAIVSDPASNSKEYIWNLHMPRNRVSRVLLRNISPMSYLDRRVYNYSFYSPFLYPLLHGHIFAIVWYSSIRCNAQPSKAYSYLSTLELIRLFVTDFDKQNKRKGRRTWHKSQSSLV